MPAAPTADRLHPEHVPPGALVQGPVGTMWRVLDNALRHIGPNGPMWRVLDNRLRHIGPNGPKWRILIAHCAT
jgi:hypothetical protein